MNKFNKNKSHFNKYGYCIINSFFNKKEIVNLDKKVETFIKKKSNKLKGKNINFTKNKSINTVHDVDKFENFFKKFALRKKNLDLAGFFLDSKPEFRKCEIFSKPAKTGLPAPLHQDNYLWALKNNNGITFWIALDKSNKNNGGLFYVKSSHKLGLLKHENSFMPGTSQRIPKKLVKKKRLSNIVTPSLKPGDMLIHHCLTIHGSNANKSLKSRRGFTIQYKDKKSGYDKTLLKHYKINLIKQLKARNRI